FDAEEPTNNVNAFKILRGHSSSVQSVCFGSWDSTINLWRTNESDSDGDLVSVKKRKMNSKAKESHLEVCKRTIYSASWDHSIGWDVETVRCIELVLNDLDVGGDSSRHCRWFLQRLSCSLHLILPGSLLASGMTARDNIYSHQIDEPIAQVEADKVHIRIYFQSFK
ncbi:hypothetical protein MKW92_043197, partial [Papaver armeniacum]